MSPMSSSRWPARYGYQSARAGSQRWMCASTIRSMVAAIAPPTFLPACTTGDRAARRTMEPVGHFGASERDAPGGIRVRAQTEPLCVGDELRTGQRARVVGRDEERRDLGCARDRIGFRGLDADREGVDPVG